MRSAAFVTIVLSAVCAQAQPTLTFDEALALAGGRAATAVSFLPESVILRRARLPSVRAEVSGNASRTVHPFITEPLESNVATTAVAFDYPLWDGGATQARIDLAEARLNRHAGRAGVDDARFTQLLDTFGELYLAQRQSDLLQPLYERLAAEATRSAELLDSGEISNLTAADRRDAALSHATRLLDLDTRRAAAAARLALLTGLETEPKLTVDLAEIPADAATRGSVRDATAMAVEESAARLRQVAASSRLRVTLSGSAGVAAAESNFRNVDSSGWVGVYGLRLHLLYPLFGGMTDVTLAEARGDFLQSQATRDAVIDSARARASSYRTREEAARRRITLLRRGTEEGKAREESLARLVAAGVRSQNDLLWARAERARRQAELLSAEVERWKAVRLLAWVSSAGGPDQP